MKVYPNLSIQLNKKLDEDICLQFLDIQKAGVDFGATIMSDHPFLVKAKKTNNFNKRSIIVDNYIESYYQKNGQELTDSVKAFRKQWKTRKKSFFNAVATFFDNNEPLPNGKYTAFVSIFNCNPRFLEHKAFQVYWKHPKGFTAVACHEILHFLFYNLIDQRFPDLNSDQEKLWELSEIVNFFILNNPVFLKITNDPYPDLYPQLRNSIKRYNKIWEKVDNSVSKFLEKTINRQYMLK